MRRWLLGVVVFLGGSSSIALANDGLLGRWEGTYTCGNQRDIVMTLTVDKVAAGKFSGVFEFETGKVRGSYSVAGAVDAAGAFRLDPGQWIKRPSGYRGLAMAGQLAPGGETIEGKFPRCARGGFQAARTGTVAPSEGHAPVAELPQPASPLEADPRSVDHAAWAAALRANIAELLERNESDEQAWRDIKNIIGRSSPRGLDRALRESLVVEIEAAQTEVWARGIRVEIARLVEKQESDNWAWRTVDNLVLLQSPRHVDHAAREQLHAEIDAARAGVRAEALLVELASGPDRLSDGGMGRVLWVVDQALASKWPEDVVARVVEAGRARAAEVLRPELQTAAGLAADLPATLDGLRRARTALAPVENYRASMIRAFGTIDPEGLLHPLWFRIAQIELDPALQDELRAALAEARLAENPPLATAALIEEVFGTADPPAAFASIIAEGRELAAVAAIEVEDRSPTGADPLEPTAADIAAFARKRVRDGNTEYARYVAWCVSGGYGNDPVAAIECLPATMVGQAGGIEGRLVRIVKIGCEVEVPGQQFLCNFLQDIEIVPTAGGALAPDLIEAVVGKLIPGGYQGEVVDARFVRNETTGEDTWDVTWGDLR